MTTSKTTSKERGFTIIEVLIVLAIAGLILLIVFLAVPALQRNSRNTQYKSDAASILAAATEFTNNNNGTIPTSADSTAILDLTNSKSITGVDISADDTAQTPTFDTAKLVTGVKCDADSADGTATYPLTDSSTRAMVMVYAVENSKGEVVAQCTES